MPNIEYFVKRVSFLSGKELFNKYKILLDFIIQWVVKNLMPKHILIPIIITLLLTAAVIAAATSHAQSITGKVTGIADGETIIALRQNDRTQHKIRFYGIDGPESHQDFGTRAKQFVSDLVFKKDVRVVQKDKERYGRVVDIVYLEDT